MRWVEIIQKKNIYLNIYLWWYIIKIYHHLQNIFIKLWECFWGSHYTAEYNEKNSSFWFWDACIICVLTVQFVHNSTSGLLVIVTHWKVANLCKIKCKVNSQLLVFLFYFSIIKRDIVKNEVSKKAVNDF